MASDSSCAPAPSLKIATNNVPWNWQREHMDLNCESIPTSDASIEEKGAELFQPMHDTASGRRIRGEDHRYGQNEFVPWQIGVIA